MKYLILSVLLFNTGCIIILKKEDAKISDGAFKLSLKEKENLWIKGTSLSLFVQVWGEPEGMVADRATAVLYYDTSKGPFKFIFVNRKLSEWHSHFGKLNEVMSHHYLHSNMVGN